ncbi:MAG TPA: CHAD domain-containing protein [Candidatus Acidoferrales bacterium]
MAHKASLPAAPETRRIGLQDWMAQVADLTGKVQHGWRAADVHDLRTAIRRCRTMAEALSEVNPDPGWRKLKKATRKLFRSLGELRDTQVKLEWVKKLAVAADPLRKDLKESLERKMATQREACRKTLGKFDSKEWRKLSKKLADKARFFPLESVVFQRLALARLNEAETLYSLARKGRSRIGWHRLRLGLKHFRYTLENFLPQRGGAWLEDLKHLQDLLGEVHDLDMLRRQIWRHKTRVDVAHLERWLGLIETRRKRRLAEFMSKVSGSPSAWQSWRDGFRSVPTLQLVPATAVATAAAQSAS